MVNFGTWNEGKLRDYIRFAGKDPKNKPHDELVLKAVKVYSADQHSLPRFEAHWSQTHGGAGAAPMPGGAFPPMGGAFPPMDGPPMGGGTANPYPSIAYPGAAPGPGAGQYPTPGANPYGGSQPIGRSAQPVQYPTLDFTAPAPGGAPGAAAASPYPSFPSGGTGMPPGAAPAASSNPYPAAGPGGPGGGAMPQPQASSNSYPIPGGGSSAPAAGSGPSNPYPLLSVAGAPAVNPYGASSPAPAAGSSNPYPSAAFPAPGAAGHSGAFPTPTPAAAQQSSIGQAQHPKQKHRPGMQQGGHPQQHPQQQQQHHQQQQRPQQQQATGRKKALLVGCNYPGTRSELKGCCTDVGHIEYLLKTRFGFQDITVLRDDLRRQDVMPTKRNILAHIDRLVHGAQAGDSLFFHFSGHGSQKRDYSGDESDGMNETLVPTDYERAGQLVDDELNKRLVNPLPTGVRLHALLDACHSGTGLDLPYVTKMEKSSGKLYWVSEGPTRVYKGTRGGLAVQFGACKDSQLAQDTAALSGGTHTGAATYLFIQSVEQLIGSNQPLTYGRIISEMLRQIKEFQKKQSGGRGLEQDQTGSTRAGMGGMLAGMLINGALASMSGGGGGGGGLSGLMSAFLGGGSMSGQTPQLSSSDAFDLNMSMNL